MSTEASSNYGKRERRREITGMHSAFLEQDPSAGTELNPPQDELCVIIFFFFSPNLSLPLSPSFGP